MKRSLLLLSLALAVPAFAGTSSKQVIAPEAPAEPALWQWFVGGTGGYLINNEEAFYSAQVGVDTPWTLAGANIALYLEVGYTDLDQSFSDIRDTSIDFDTEIIPVTLNIKFERAIVGNLNFYAGAGAGVGFVDAEVRGFGDSESDKDTVFVGQAFAGVVYNITPHFEVFGGARYIHIEDPDVFGSTDNGDFLIHGDDAIVEAGLRYNF